MKLRAFLVLSLPVFVSCAHMEGEHSSTRRPAQDAASVTGYPTLPALKNGQPYKADDETLKVGDLDIWKLQKMAEAKQYDQLNYLFNHGVTMDGVPRGYAAGTGARVLNYTTSLDILASKDWRGKIFCNSTTPSQTHGLNRINSAIIPEGRLTKIYAVGAFISTQVATHELVSGNQSSLVLLNYAHPQSRAFSVDNLLQDNLEKILKVIPVYDIMVAVPGKYGPVYLGKTWLGSYDSTNVFHTAHPDFLIAWYFLDFNKAALDEQKNNQWEGGTEPPLAGQNAEIRAAGLVEECQL